MGAIIADQSCEADLATLRSGEQPEGFDPYSVYHRLRTLAPVWQAPWGDWYLSSYRAVTSAFVHPACRSSPNINRGLVFFDGTLVERRVEQFFADWLLYLDGSTQPALRRELLRLFSAARLQSLEGLIEDVCRDLLARNESKCVNIVDALARPLPITVIAHVINLPHDDIPRVAHWAGILRAALDCSGSVPEDELTNAVIGMQDYFSTLVVDQTWRKGPAHADLDHLLQTYSKEAVAANLALLAFAGHETTVHLIGNMLLHLAQRPALWRRLREAPQLVDAAVEETLRFESPVQKICRWTCDAVELDGGTIPRDQLVVLLLGAANRDPDQFIQPDMFDIDRPRDGHLAFGRGRHLCLGRSLALLEAAITLRVLLETWSEVAVAKGGWQWLTNSSFRGLSYLHLEWSPAFAPGPDRVEAI